MLSIDTASTLSRNALKPERAPLHADVRIDKDAYKRAKKQIRRTFRLLGLLPLVAAGECAVKNNIHDLRKRNKWTLKKLAKVAGIPYNTVYRMEQGLGARLENAYKVAAALQVTVYDLYPILPTKSVPVAKDGEQHSVHELRMKRDWPVRQLAKASGVALSTLSNVEKGFPPKVDKAIRIAAALGVSVYQIWKP